MTSDTINDLILRIANLQGDACINPQSERIEIKDLPPISEQFYLLGLDKLSEGQSYFTLAKFYLERGE